MATSNKNLSESSKEIKSAKGKKFGIVVSEWNENITSKLASGCKDTLLENGVDSDDIKILRVPGSFELVLGAKMLLGEENMDAIICLGCVIKGETKHDEYISAAVANGIMSLGVFSSKPIIFGVLTTNNEEQAEERAGGKHGNKGVEAANTALQMVHLKSDLKSKKKKIGFA